jgi:curved DNA-binding protein CbpA
MSFRMKPFAALPLLLLCIQLHLSKSMRFNFHKSTPHNNIDPYATLSLHPTATPTQIQKAYRTKARETHPDKNPSPNANEEFRLISEAFDILSDPKKKRMFDQQRIREERIKAEQMRREERQRYAEQREREQALMRKHEMIQKARSGYDGVLKWSKLSHFEDVAIDDQNKVYTTNVLIMFVGNKAAEKKGEEEYYFPYPFVGNVESTVSKDVLLVAKVRFSTIYSISSQRVYINNSSLTLYAAGSIQLTYTIDSTISCPAQK